MIKIIKRLWRKTLEALGLYSINFRFWIVQNILKEDERWLIKRAIDDRKEYLEKIKVNEKWIDIKNVSRDIEDYNELGRLFTSDSWN